MSDQNRQRNDRMRDSRSKSPQRDSLHAHRTRSPHSHHRRHKKSPKPEVAKELPYNSRYLTKRDYAVFKPMFALYLDIQKQKILDDLDEVEAKGRWKSFIGKWNRAELSEGWYDPSTLQKSLASAKEQSRDFEEEMEEPSGGRKKAQHRDDRPAEPVGEVRDPDSDSEDSVGPSLPGKEGRRRVDKHGPSIPRLDDLELKREMDLEDQHTSRTSLHHSRKADLTAQKSQLDELIPRADPGTRERRLEKKADLNAKLRSFRDGSPSGAVADVPESELMGTAEDGVADFRRRKQEVERKKNERELRREEVLRARAAERDERMREYRGKEEKTMEMLRGLARQNFG